MDLVKLGKKGQVTIPKAILRQAGIAEDAPLLIAAVPDGSIVLRPAGVYPIELYTDERIAEFERENAIPAGLVGRVEKLVRTRRKKPR
ncbi:MAG: AbrB/MazE/SpoVT family DNA-binding domain-containing protein [Betaproteobacteria bacterium]|nr:AbrB/MazE/SpoVT family DNA-binding domain-containing protein [Betaproteobacteria bacterium]